MAKKKAAKRAAKKPAAKSGKKISTKAAAQTGESKKRYPSARFTIDTLGLHTGVIASELNPTPRDYSDREKLQKLYTLGIVLQYWASRFERRAVTAIAAGSVDSCSLQRLLAYVKDQVEEYAPEATTPETASRTGRLEEIRLDDAVFMAMHMPKYMEDNYNFRLVPIGPFPDGDVPVDCPMELEWEPPDDPPATLVRDSLREPVAAAARVAVWEDFDNMTARVARLADAAVDKLLGQINDDQEGGFSRSQVDTLMQARPEGSSARRLHGAFVSTLDALAGLAGRSDSIRWVDSMQLSQRLQDLYGDWCDTCFAPTVTGKSQAVRSNRQSKKKVLRRLVATVTQYGKLLRGAAEMPRVTAAIESLGFLGQRLEQAIKKVWTDIAQPDAREVGPLVRTLDEKAVTDRQREVWIRSLGPRADACGRLAEIIAGYEQCQEDPWEPKEHLAKLKDAGIFTRSNHDDEFTEIRYRMQVAGIAVQGPWKFIEGKRAEPETKSGVRDKWLLNPMAQILAQHPD
jgi:hypothetical protein